MGMRYKRCPRCNKQRRRAEDSKTKPEKRWVWTGSELICFVCAATPAVPDVTPTDD